MRERGPGRLFDDDGFKQGRFGPRLGSSRCSSSRLGSPRFGPSIIGAFRVSLGSFPFDPSRFVIESDLELELVERPRASTATSSSYAFRQLELKIQISSVGTVKGRLDPQCNRAQHSSTRHDTFQLSTARHNAAQPVARHITIFTLSIVIARRPRLVSWKRFRASNFYIHF